MVQLEETERGGKCVSVCVYRKVREEIKEAENYRTRREKKTRTKNDTDISSLRRGQVQKPSCNSNTQLSNLLFRQV